MSSLVAPEVRGHGGAGVGLGRTCPLDVGYRAIPRGIDVGTGVRGSVHRCLGGAIHQFRARSTRRETLRRGGESAGTLLAPGARTTSIDDGNVVCTYEVFD